MPPAPPAPPASPPKRMTRARAKAVEETQQTQVITTAGAKAAASKTKPQATRLKPAPNTKATKENLKEQQAVAPTKPAPKRTTRANPKPKETAPISRKDDATDAASKTKGRPRSASVKKDDDNPAPSTAQQVPKRTTRGKAAAQQAAPAAAPAKSATRKRVTFQDEHEADKENASELRPASKDGKGIVVEKTSATMSQAPRKGRAAVPKPQKDNTPRPAPLSPKKATQVAKGQAAKLTAAETIERPPSPTKLLNQSPQKQIPTPKRATEDSLQATAEAPDSPIDELQLPGDGSPVKPSTSALNGSPPKRPPPSPFKTTMRDSPKKINLGNSDHSSKSGDSEDIGVTMSLSQTPARRPPSPIKLFQDASSKKDIHTPGKAPLLQSPAKRPGSSIKPFNFQARTPHSGTETPSLKPTVSVLRQSPQKFSVPSMPLPPKLTKEDLSPIAPPKPPSLTAEERDDMLVDELVNAPSPFTPAPKQVSERGNPAEIANQLVRESPNNGSPLQEVSRSPQLSHAEVPFDELHTNQDLAVEIFSDSPVPSTTQDTPPAHPSAAFQLRSPPVQWSPGNESEDELMSDDPKYDVSPTRRARNTYATPAPLNQTFDKGLSMTGLAEKFGGWSRATPDTKVLQQREADAFIFSPVKQQQPVAAVGSSPRPVPSSPTKTNSFEDAIKIHEDDIEMATAQPSEVEDVFRQSKTSEASQEYGNENEPQIDQVYVVPVPETPETCTPQRLEKQQQRVIHTVSKVPLKPAGDVGMSPDAKANMKKRRSAANALTPRTDLELQALRQIYPRSSEGSLLSRSTGNEIIDASDDAQVVAHLDLATPVTGSPTMSLLATPARTPQSDSNSKLLDGAVVFVDVHTSEGADASGIFVDLLQQMGAAVRSTWSWNPPSIESDTTEASEPKVGITHVVFKDGGKRTMEKVRLAKGAVACVGVGWVLDCEREDKWLDESEYAIDTTFVPRGGHRRRKSMEPKLLSNLNGTLSAAHTPRKSPSQSNSQRRVTIAIPASSNDDSYRSPEQPHRTVDAVDLDDELDELAGPASSAPETDFAMPLTPARPGLLTGGANSPTTPYFLHPTQLVQQTCPPKQTQQAFFPLSGRIEDQPDESLRRRLMDARRKSMQFAPKVKSPLARNF